MLNPYVILAAAAAFCTTGAGAYLKGRADCAARHEIAALQEQRDALQRLWDTSETAGAADAQRLAGDDALLRDLQQKAEDDAKTIPDGERLCFDPADADSLRRHFRTAQ